MTVLTDSINAAGSNSNPTDRAALALARELAGRTGLTELSQPSNLDLRFEDGLFYRADDGSGNPQVLTAFDLMATISRAGVAQIPNWSFRSGDPVGVLRESPANAARYNAPPNTAPGRIIEGAATSLNRNPRAEESAPGTIGGTGEWPTHWELIAAGGLTFEILGQRIRNGWPGLLIRVDGTQTANAIIGFEAKDGMVATTGNAYTSTFTAAIESGSVPSGATLASILYERTATPADPAVASGTSAVTLDSTLRRYAHSRTFSGGGTVARGQNGFVLVRNGDDRTWSNVEIFLAAPNFVAASSATSPILPPAGTLASATRAAETVTEGVVFTRASWATAMAWNGVSGSVAGPIEHFPPNAVRVADGGLWCEPDSTNKIRNPLFVGASSPSTWPTHMAVNTAGGMTWTCDGRGEDEFGTYLQITLSGTATGNARFYLESSGTYIPGVNGDDRVLSLGTRVISGTLPGSPALEIFEREASGTQVKRHQSPTLTIDRQFRRHWFHKTLDGGGTVAAMQPAFLLDSPSGTVACTFRLYIPQVEYGIRPTMPMLPPSDTIAEATRAAERAYLIVPDLIAMTGFTLAVEYTPVLDTTTGYSASTPFIAALQPTSDTAGYAAVYQSGANAAATIRSGSASIAFGSAQGAMATGERRRQAVAYGADDMASSVNGEDQLTDASGTISETFTQLELGRVAGGSAWQGLIHAVRLGVNRAPNADCEALVGN